MVQEENKSSGRKGVLILGGGSYQVPAIVRAKKLGLYVACVDMNPNCPGARLADDFFCVSTRDIKGVLRVASELYKKGALDGVFTIATDVTLTLASVAERYALVGPSVEVARRCTHKGLMKEAFKKAGVPTPAFDIAMSPREGLRVAAKIGFPVVLKPADNSGARGVSVVFETKQFKKAFKLAKRFSYCGEVIVEEFVPGPEFSCDALVYKGKITILDLADRLMAFPPNFIEIGHTVPSRFPKGIQKKLIETAMAGIEALGMDNCGMNCDLKLSPKGPVLLEMACRLSGDRNASDTIPLAMGVDPVREGIKMAVGDVPQIAPRPVGVAMLRTVFPVRPVSPRRISLVKSLPGVWDIEIRGLYKKAPGDNPSRPGYVITYGKTYRQALHAFFNALKFLNL